MSKLEEKELKSLQENQGKINQVYLIWVQYLFKKLT